MSLGTYLLEKAVEKAAPTIADVAIKTTIGITTVAVGTATAVASGIAVGATAAAGGAAKKVSDVCKAKKARDEQERSKVSDYDVSLVCAKVAISSYIIHADNKVTDEEQKYIDQIFTNIKNEYGADVYAKTKRVYKNCATSFMNVQDYLRKVNENDLKQYFQAADEVALIDGYDDSEARAIQRIKDFVYPRENVSFQEVNCTSCGGKLKLDEYGYKAVCPFCGAEIIVNSHNEPVTAHNDTAREQRAENEDKQIQKDKKKGKIALKVALGVMTGGVSLIPDAVGAAKKKSKG